MLVAASSDDALWHKCYDYHRCKGDEKQYKTITQSDDESTTNAECLDICSDWIIQYGSNGKNDNGWCCQMDHDDAYSKSQCRLYHDVNVKSAPWDLYKSETYYACKMTYHEALDTFSTTETNNYHIANTGDETIILTGLVGKKTYELVLNEYGNLIKRVDGTITHEAGESTNEQITVKLEMHPNRNLYLYHDGKAVWSTATKTSHDNQAWELVFDLTGDLNIANEDGYHVVHELESRMRAVTNQAKAPKSHKSNAWSIAKGMIDEYL